MIDNYLTFSELAQIIPGDIKQNIPVALFSRPGTGKSSFLKDLAAMLKTEVFTITINQIPDRADLTGVRLVDKLDSNGEKYYQQEAFPHATLMEAIHYAQNNPGKPVIIFLDEFNRGTPDVTTATLSFTTERKIGTIKFPKNIRFVLAGNKEGNVIPFDDATATRFANYDIVPDVMTYIDVNPNLNPFIKDMLIDNPGYLLGEAAPAKGTNNQPNPYAANGPDPKTPDDEEDFQAYAEESGITQDRTVPRTLSMMSDWLNGENISKSGSVEEKQALEKYLQETERSTGAHFRPTLLQVSVESKIGQTATALELVSRIIAYNDELNKLSSTTSANGNGMSQSFQNILNHIRPDVYMIDEMTELSSRTELVDLVERFDNEELCSTMLWLITSDAYSTLDGDVSPVEIMEEIAPRIGELDKRSARLFNQIIGHPDNIVKRSITTLKKYTPNTNTSILSLVAFAETMIE